MTDINLSSKFNNQTFQPFIQRDNQGYSSYIQYQNNPLTQENDTFDSQNRHENRKKRKHEKLMMAVETLGIIAGLALVGLSFNKLKYISNKLQKWAVSVDKNFHNVKNKHLHKFFSLMTSSFDRAARVVTNSSTIKDYTVHQVMGKTSITKKLRDWFANIYTNENKNAVFKSLKKSRDSYNEFTSSVESAVIQTRDQLNKKNLKCLNSKYRNNIDDKTHPWQLLQERLKEARNTPEFLLPYSLESRYNEMGKDMQYLLDEISLKRLSSKEALQGFVAEDILEHRRMDFVKGILKEKNEISRTFDDIGNYAKNKLTDTNALIYMFKDPFRQKDLKEASVELEKSIKTYAKDSKISSNRVAVTQNIMEKIAKFREKAELLPESPLKEKLINHIEEYHELFKNNDKGIVQEIRELAGQVWGSDSEFDISIKTAANKHIKDLETSFNRTVNMFDKQRDITIGSGAADILGLSLPVAGYFYALSNDDTNDKKIGTSLELGIPILGGIGVYFYALAKQLNGFRALSFSVGTGAVLNFIGSSIYKKYKEYKADNDKKNHSNPPVIAQ